MKDTRITRHYIWQDLSRQFNMTASVWILLCLSLLLSLDSKSQNGKDVYLLPSDYKGKVVVIYNRPFGDKAAVSNDTTYYNIPPDGISVVTTQSTLNLKESHFFQIDPAGRKRKLDILSYDIIISSPDSISLKEQVGVFIFGSLGSCNPNEPESICYSDFYVGSFNEMPRYYTPEKAADFSSKVYQKAKWRR